MAENMFFDMIKITNFVLKKNCFFVYKKIGLCLFRKKKLRIKIVSILNFKNLVSIQGWELGKEKSATRMAEYY